MRSLQQGSVDAESLARRVTNLSLSLTFSRLILPKSDGEGGRLPSKVRWTGGDEGESGLRSTLGTTLMGEAMWMLGSARAEENGRRWDGEGDEQVERRETRAAGPKAEQPCWNTNERAAR